MEQSDYKKLYQDMLPKGPAWSRNPKATISKLGDAAAAFFFYTHQRVEKAAREMFPDSCSETLVDWEKMLELPEPCEHGNHAKGQTFRERIDAVIAKINRNISPTIENFIKLAEFLGYEVIVVTTPPSVCGIARCGEHLGGAHEANYYWITIIDSARINYARCGSAVCGEPLCHITWAEDLECLLNRIKPAHTLLKFSYAKDEGVKHEIHTAA